MQSSTATASIRSSPRHVTVALTWWNLIVQRDDPERADAIHVGLTDRRRRPPAGRPGRPSGDRSVTATVGYTHLAIDDLRAAVAQIW